MLRGFALGSVLVLCLVAAAARPAPSNPAPALYTADQAREGKAVYDQSCAKCHGATLSDGAAPNLVGPAFTASSLSFGGLHQTITQDMPMDAPASLTPKQYAAVIAYLLAVNCYPAGRTAFPESGQIPNHREKVATQGDGKGCALAAP